MQHSQSFPFIKIAFFALLITLVMQGSVYAEEYRGRILKVNGDVHIITEKGEMRKLEESKFLVREMDTIVTTENGSAVVRFNDGSMSVMSEKSQLRVEKTNWLSHIGGKIYFTFRKVFGKPKKVRTRFATIGVRGTTFIITDDDITGQGVALQEGLVEVESPGEAFEIHREQEEDEFAAFKQGMRERQQQIQDEFAEYKNETMQQFVEYKKEFLLEPNYVIRFDGNRVDETKMTENDMKEFEAFEAIAGEMLRQFREQSKQVVKDQQEKKQLEEALE